jgi:hypothetical protein
MRCAVLAVAIALLSASAAEAGKFHYSHRFVATGHVVDHWTIDDPRDCGPIGDGTTTVDFTSVKPSKALVVISPTHNAEPNNTLGSWTLLAPGDAFGHITDIGSKPAMATVDLVDNTTPRPPSYGGDCGGGIDKSGCGAHPLKGARVEVSGYNRKLIKGDLDGEFRPPSIDCNIGNLSGFSDPPAVAGGNRIGEMLIKMPKPSKFRTHKVVTVTATTHKTSSYGDPGSATVTSDVTRTFTVTFTRLR